MTPSVSFGGAPRDLRREDFFRFECIFGFKAVLTLEKVLGFKERHAASCIAFVFDVRGTAVVVLEMHLTMKKKTLRRPLAATSPT